MNEICGVAINIPLNVFIKVIKKHKHIKYMTPEIMYKLTEKIVVYTPDKSIGHYTHQIGIYYRFDITDSMKYNKKNWITLCYTTFSSKIKNFFMNVRPLLTGNISFYNSNIFLNKNFIRFIDISKKILYN